jgi:hypothetical protein
MRFRHVSSRVVWGPEPHRYHDRRALAGIALMILATRTALAARIRCPARLESEPAVDPGAHGTARA